MIFVYRLYTTYDYMRIIGLFFKLISIMVFILFLLLDRYLGIYFEINMKV